MNIKYQRIESIINKEISNIIQFDIKDPKLGFCTITDVRVTNDYSYAKVYISFLGKQTRKDAGLKVLNKAKGHIRSLLSSRISIKKTPELIFILDDSLDKANRIENILKSIKE